MLVISWHSRDHVARGHLWPSCTISRVGHHGRRPGRCCDNNTSKNVALLFRLLLYGSFQDNAPPPAKLGSVTRSFCRLYSLQNKKKYLSAFKSCQIIQGTLWTFENIIRAFICMTTDASFGFFLKCSKCQQINWYLYAMIINEFFIIFVYII